MDDKAFQLLRDQLEHMQSTQDDHGKKLDRIIEWKSYFMGTVVAISGFISWVVGIFFQFKK